MHESGLWLYTCVENMNNTQGEVYRLKIESGSDDLIRLPDIITLDYELTREQMITDGWEEMNDPPSRFRRSHARRRIPALLAALWHSIVAAVGGTR